MYFSRFFSVSLILFFTSTTQAQGWFEYINQEDLFTVNLPGSPEVSNFTYQSELEAEFPARNYEVFDRGNHYKVTVVDFTEAQEIHWKKLENERESEQLRGRNRWITDQRSSVARAAREFRQRDGEVTYDAWGHLENVEGHQLQLTNPDGSRTFVAIYLHGQVNRLYILEGTVPPRMPPPAQFQQSLRFLDNNGARVRYELSPDGGTTRVARGQILDIDETAAP
ncbi:MAG: hypothetical protein CMM56_07475 [Rhodospirillaceae bacterium]|nr:hypothetical protein [Rhodospirillaceae bacterium]|tara:strand:- start:496 stop:1167 length:672 start_codon:yes stop_codon:yes gene_type:complete